MGKIMANISQMEATGELSKYYINLRPSKYRVSTFKVFIVLEQREWVFFCYKLYSVPCKITKQALKFF
jgi:hypothetical protein